MTPYERLSLLALAEIIDLLSEARHPGQYVNVGIRRQELVDMIHMAVAEEEPA